MNQRFEAAGQCHFGVVGLGAMGANFALNVAESGLKVIGLDPDPDRVREFITLGSSFTVSGTSGIEEFVQSLNVPRKILLLVPAGKTVDALIDQILPLLHPGDVLLDGGNSFFGDSDRRFARLTATKVHYLGVGVSGGAEGARRGASIMPGGSLESYKIVQAVLEKAAAEVEGNPCVAWIGRGSAGHYVKMVHNGIEYALMQLIAESYDVLKQLVGMSNQQLTETFETWNQGALNSFLLEITAQIFRQEDDLADGHLIDAIKDKAKQKGTGQWTSQNAFELGVPVPTIHAAVVTRAISSLDSERARASSRFAFESNRGIDCPETLVDDVRDALLFGYILAFDQGLRMISSASVQYDYGIQLETCARIWRGGCIIRARLLEDIRQEYLKNPDLESLLFSELFQERLNHLHSACRRVATAAIQVGIPLPGMTASLAYFDSFRAARLPMNLVQAQRDFFGMHSYERLDREGNFHMKKP